MLFGEKTVSLDSVFCFCRRDVAATTKLLVSSAERLMKWCHSNDDEIADNAVQRLSVLSRTVDRKAAVAPAVILRRMVYTACAEK